MGASSLSFAVPLVFFLLIGALGLTLTAATGRLRRGSRDRMAAMAEALPAGELGPARALVRASLMSVRMRRLGWLLAVAITVVALLSGDAGDGGTFVIFGCGYLAAVALSEAMMPKPEPGRPQRAVLEARRPADYVPRWLMWALRVCAALGFALCVTTIIYDAAVRSVHVACSPSPGTPLQTSTIPRDTPLTLSAAMALAYVVIWLATRAVLGQIASRARPSGHPTLIIMDDALRRAAALRVAAAGLSAALLTLPIPLGWLDRSVNSPCWSAPQTADSVLRWLMLVCVVSGLATLVFVPSGASRLKALPVAPPAEPGDGTATHEGSDA